MQDRASGVGGEFVIVERRSDRQRRRSSAGGASGLSGASGLGGASGASGLSGLSGAEDRPPSARRSSSEASSPRRRERVNSDAMFSETGTFPIAHFKREQDEDVLTNLVLRLVDTTKQPRWTPTVRISLSEPTLALALALTLTPNP